MLLFSVEPKKYRVQSFFTEGFDRSNISRSVGIDGHTYWADKQKDL